MLSSLRRREILAGLRLIKRDLQFQTSRSESGPRIPPILHPYQQIYPWKTLDDFVEYLSSKVLFNDGRVVAIPKPFGVGTHFPDAIIKRPTQIDPKRFGDVKYCVKDALPGLAAKLNLPELHVAFTIDRTVSGIALLGTDKRLAEKINLRARHARFFRRTPMTWWCITSGIPLLKQPSLREKVAIERIEIDPRTKGKDFEILYNATKSYINNTKRDVTGVRTEIRVLEGNKFLNIALVEVKSSRLQYNFLRCYLASKACFALGDIRFCTRVGHILGVPISMPARSTGAVREPLPEKIMRKLQVNSNAAIPLMIHMNSLQLYNYPRGRLTTTIVDPSVPEFFQWTLQKLISRQ